jgi:hypothetical protein
VCLDYPDFIEHVQPILGSSQEELDETLDKFVGEMINAKVEINVINRQIKMPRLFETYRADFSKDSQAVLEFIYRYLEDPELDYN